MKIRANFRLDPQTNNLLEDLADRLQISKTEVVEKALRNLDASTYKNPLMKYVGNFPPDLDVEEFLKDIKESRKNKDIKVDI